jgi:hypothetical protein
VLNYPKKTLRFSHLSRSPSLKATFFISQSNDLQLSKQGISLPFLLFDLYFLGLGFFSKFFLHSFSNFFLFSSLSIFFFSFSSFFFFFFQIVHSFSFLLSVFFPHPDINHQYNWVGILKGITNIIRLKSESVFLSSLSIFFPILDVVYFFPLY